MAARVASWTHWPLKSIIGKALRSLPLSTTVTLGCYLSRSRLTTVLDFVYPVWNDELSDFRGIAIHQLLAPQSGTGTFSAHGG